jgi:DNA gyrase/topoisomerase IV subunit A
MKASEIIVLQAISSALAKFNSSDLSGDLQKQISDAISNLENLVAKNDSLNQLYKTERQKLKKDYQVQERSKGYWVADDDSNDSDPENVSPPSPQSDTSDLDKHPTETSSSSQPPQN